MKEQTLWFLENIDVTGIFCPKKMDKGHLHVEKKFNKGEYIYLPDSDANKIYFIFEGRIKIGTKREDGKELTKTVLGPGEVFGEMVALGQTKRHDFAQALEDTIVCIVDKSDLRNMYREHGQFQAFLLRVMGSRMLEMEQRLESLVFKDSRSRIIEFLCELARKKGKRIGYEVLIKKFLPHQEIANLTATSRQTVTTTLNELRRDNLITFNRRRLLIRDLDALEKQIRSSTDAL